MMQRELERIGEIEELIDLLRESKAAIAHNQAELSVVNDKIIDYQNEYVILTGHYYPTTETFK